ncbi:MAG: RNA polymerase sigma-70 factor, partial [Bacteroidota bacterium]
RLLKEDNLAAFEYLFKKRYQELLVFSVKVTQLQVISEEIVQDIFVYLWENRNNLIIKSSLKSYLYTAVKHRSIDYVKSKYARMQSVVESEGGALQIGSNLTTDENLHEQELATVIQAGLQNLPEKCRIIFLMSRDAGLTYQEIAEALSISPKTVKAQMGIALKKMKAYLLQYWDKIIILIISML